MNEKNKKIAFASVMAALICIATMIIKIPSPLKGYVNLGDCAVLLAGWLSSPLYCFLAASIGSAFADIFSGYAVYAPATFIIKGLMAITAFYVYNLFRKKLGDTFSHIISGIIAEALMIVGYYVFEGVLYGFIPSAVNIPANCMQGIAGIVIGVMLIKVLKRIKNDLY